MSGLLWSSPSPVRPLATAMDPAPGALRPRFVLRMLLVCAACLLVGLAPAPTAAQQSGVDLSEETREKLYESLRRQEPEIERLSSVLKTVVRLVGPTVVHIETAKDESGASRFGGRRVIEEAGSGVVIREKGRCYVLTNWHVIKSTPPEAIKTESIKIKFSDGRELNPASKAEIWHDAATDVAVMAVKPSDLQAARLGDSSRVEIGDFVLAVGSPFGLSHSVTYGIVSAKGRRDLELGDEGVRYQDFLQTDAAINPGNSGGPLINLRGEVIGINTAIASNSGGNEGIGFSIPINMVMTVARQLIERGVVVRAYLGVHLNQKFSSADAIEMGLPRLSGALINGITARSPAEAANLRVGDVILRFDGVPVENDAHLINLVSLVEVDREIPVVVYRQKHEMTIMVKVGNRTEFEPRADANGTSEGGTNDQFGWNDLDAWDVESLGLRVVAIDQAVIAKLRLQRKPGGLLITAVDPKGPTAGRMRPGEIIDQVEQRPVVTIADLEKTLARTDPARGLRVRVRSAATDQSSPRLLVIKPSPALRSAQPQGPRVRQAAGE